MSVTLREVLTLVGRLDDAPGPDTPRERFRRFIDDRVTDVAATRDLLHQCQEALGDQHARARQDLVVALGRLLGFDVVFGTYEPRAAAHVGGQWRSRRHMRIVLEVRSEQTAEAGVDELARTVAALNATSANDDEEPWIGLCVTTPFYAARRRLEALLGQREGRDIRCVSLDALLWLVDMSGAGRLGHDDVARLLTSGPDSEFTIDLMRRFSAGAPSASVGDTSQLREPSDAASADDVSESVPPPAVRFMDPMRATGFWLACLSNDENASPELVLDSVIRRRQLLGVSDTGGFPPAAKAGDWVCFFIEGAGIVGHAQLDGTVADTTAMIRGARRFSAVFRLQHVGIYDVANPIGIDSPLRRLASRMPENAAGAFLSAVSRADYELVTSRVLDSSRATAI